MSDRNANGAAGVAGATPERNLHTFVAYVADKPGVLASVASLFRRRNYNIDSLTVGRTEVDGVSRMTIVLATDPATARLVEANLYKMVNVLRVEDVTDEPTVQRDLAFIKVSAGPQERGEILQIAEVFRARVVDIAPTALIVEITGTEDKIQGLLDNLRPFGIIEMVRTGSISMTRGAQSIPVDPTFLHARQREADS